jgi:hypothetical protein
VRPLVVAALSAAVACGGKSGPQISSFAVDRTTIAAGDTATLSWKVSNATQLTLDPGVGVVTGTSIAVQPSQDTTYTLTAQSGGSKATATAAITVNPRGTGPIVWFTASPPQAAPGDKVTLSWRLGVPISALSVAGLPPLPNAATSVEVFPSSTTSYTLTVQPQDSTPPASSRVVARISPKPVITSFNVPPTARQGDFVVISWDAAAATTYTLSSDKGFYRYAGAEKSTTVQASENATFTLNANGPTGSTQASAQMAVTPVPATGLAYVQPVVKGEVVQLVADACANPCTSITLRLITTQAVTADALALDLSIEGKGKVALHLGAPAPALTVNKLAIDPGFTPPAAAIALPTSGPLAWVLALGFASKPAGNGAPATPGPKQIQPQVELASFALDLLPAGGAGTVFSPSASTRFELRAGGAVVAKNPNAIAVGTLSAKP